MNWLVVIFSFILIGQGQSQIDPEQQFMLLNEINTIRTAGCKCGGKLYPPVKPLSIDNSLNKVAQLFAKEMWSRNILSHYDRNGSKAGERMKKQGYSWSYYGENIAEGFYRISDVLTGWLNSPSHCQTLMNPFYIHIGIGYYRSYWVTDFGTPEQRMYE